MLEMCHTELGLLSDEEQEAYDNIPESLQGSDAAYESEEAVENLSTANENVEDAIDALEQIS